MKLWKLAATVALGVFASGSGALQVNAATFAYQVDFIDKEVADFDDFRQSFNGNTSNLQPRLEWTFTGGYYFLPSAITSTVNITYRVFFRINNTGSYTQLINLALPDFAYTTTRTPYTATTTVNLPTSILDAIVNDDATFVTFYTELAITRSGMLGRSLVFDDYGQYFNIFYNFDTTYLFNYFLSEQRLRGTGYQRPADWTINSTRVSFLEYLYTTAGNDTYLIENSLQVDIGTTIKKYAVNVEDVYFRGESVGAQFRTQRVIGLDTYTSSATSGTENITHEYDYFFLNVSNYQQNIADVPTFEFETEDCGWDAFNIPCFINNGLAYIVNDAPVISDAFTLLNAGMRLGGQAFGIIGNFNTDNLFGVMILGGLGITAVRWFLKND
jgi:hypothetical protein